LELNTIDIKFLEDEYSIKVTFKMLATIERVTGKTCSRISMDVVEKKGIALDDLASIFNVLLNAETKRMSMDEIQQGVLKIGASAAMMIVMQAIRIGFAGSESMSSEESAKKK